MQTLTWLSKNGCTNELAAPAARHASRSYEPTGSKLYTAPVPIKHRQDEQQSYRDVARTVLFDPTEDVVHVVWKEAARVEHCLYQPCDGAQGHVFCVRVAVPLCIRILMSTQIFDRT